MTTTIHTGDALTVLRSLADESVHCIVTSPPYYGLRDYGVDGQLGAEETPHAYVAALVQVLAEGRRVLRADGTLWLNLGDSYSAGGREANTEHLARMGAATGRARALGRKTTPGFRPKSLLGIPWRVALALQDDGWILRQDIIWHKPNAMPESVTDRCTRAHEYVFMFSKQPSYHYDAAAIAEPLAESSKRRLGQNVQGQNGSTRQPGRNGRPMKASPSSYFGDGGRDKQRGHSRRHSGFNGRYAARIDAEGVPETRNARSVWTLAPGNYKAAHFAVMPTALAERCILAGCPAGGTVIDPFCGAGTTGVAALARGRHFVGIELNSDYAEMARRRIDAALPHPTLFDQQA